jgi:hypothetical protein
MNLKYRDNNLLRFEWIEPQGVRIVFVNVSRIKPVLYPSWFNFFDGVKKYA